MKLKYPLAWLAFLFAASLSGIFIASLFVQPSVAPSGLPIGWAGFVSFFPMCFFFVANALTESRQKIEALEARIKVLETEQLQAE